MERHGAVRGRVLEMGQSSVELAERRYPASISGHSKNIIVRCQIYIYITILTSKRQQPNRIFPQLFIPAVAVGPIQLPPPHSKVDNHKAKFWMLDFHIRGPIFAA